MKMSSQACFVFNAENALKADGAGIVDKGGNYLVTLKNCYVGKTQNGASFFELNGECASGEGINYLTLYTKGKDGSVLYGHNKMSALCGLLSLSTLTYIAVQVQGKTAYKVPELENKQIYIGVTREDVKDERGQWKITSKGQQAFKLEVLHFYDPKTFQTYTEKVEKKEPQTFTRQIVDKLAPAGGNQNQSQNQAGFGDFGGGDFGSSGFGSDAGFGGLGGFGGTVAPAKPIDDDLPF